MVQVRGGVGDGETQGLVGSLRAGVPGCPTHPGSSVVLNGTYGKLTKRQRFLCRPFDGSAPHKFSFEVPRMVAAGSHCDHCENRVNSPTLLHLVAVADVGVVGMPLHQLTVESSLLRFQLLGRRCQSCRVFLSRFLCPFPCSHKKGDCSDVES